MKQYYWDFASDSFQEVEVEEITGSVSFTGSNFVYGCILKVTNNKYIVEIVKLVDTMTALSALKKQGDFVLKKVTPISIQLIHERRGINEFSVKILKEEQRKKLVEELQKKDKNWYLDKENDMIIYQKLYQKPKPENWMYEQYRGKNSVFADIENNKT